jgi:hypothetical protein
VYAYTLSTAEPPLSQRQMAVRVGSVSRAYRFSHVLPCDHLSKHTGVGSLSLSFDTPMTERGPLTIVALAQAYVAELAQLQDDYRQALAWAEESIT